MTADTSCETLLILTRKLLHGGRRKGAGRKSIFTTKAVEKPFAMDFTKRGRATLRALTKRTGLSRNGVMAILALQFGDALTFDADGVAFPDKAHKVLSIRVPKDAAAKLRAARRRTRKSYSDIGEALLSRFGATASFPAPSPRASSTP